MRASELRALDDGAQAKRGGVPASYVNQFFRPEETKEKAAWLLGYEAQKADPQLKVSRDNYHLVLKHDTAKADDADIAIHETNKESTMKTRTAAELEALETEYRSSVYDEYARDQLAQGNDPQPFEEAFAAHLAAIDAAAPAHIPADAKSVKAAEAKAAKEAAAKAKADAKAAKDAEKATKAAEAAEAKAKAAADKKAAKEAAAKAKADAKPVKARMPRLYRPTPEDRAAIMATAKGIIGENGAPRLKLTNGDPYEVFLKGHAAFTDAEGKMSVVLNVFAAKDMTTKLGAVQIETSDWKLTKVVPVK